MGHPSDWDDVRAALPEYETSAVAIRPASDWPSSLKQLSENATADSILVGYSMGARLALGLVMENSQRYKGLVFISGNPGLESDKEREQRAEFDEQIATRIEAGDLRAFLEQWYQSRVFASLPSEIRRVEIERKLTRSASEWPAILRANSVSGQSNYWPRLNELAIPTLVIAGESDEKYRDIAVRFSNEASQLTVKAKVLSDCGHMVHRECAVELAQLIREFVESNPHA